MSGQFTETDDRYRRIVEAAEEGIITINAQSLIDFVNPKMGALLGYSVDDMLGRPLSDFLDDEGKQLLEYYLERRRRGVTEQFDFKFCHSDGSEVWVNVSTGPLFDSRGDYVGALAMFTDIRERREAERLLAWEKEALETIGGTNSLGQVLDELMRGLERHLPGAICSVFLVDQQQMCLRHGGAPSLDPEFHQLLDGYPIEPESAFGREMHGRRQRIVPDITIDPLWENYREYGLARGLRASWSTPIHDGAGSLISIFVVYYREPRGPNSREQLTLERAAHLARLAIERKRAEELLAASQIALKQANDSLQQSNEKLERRVLARTQQLRALASQLTQVEERERLRLADAIHEGLLQLLMATSLRLEGLRDPADLASLDQGLDSAQALVQEAVKLGKAVVRDLYPPALHTLGLGGALGWLAQQHRAQGLEVEVRTPPGFDVPEKELRITLYRAAHELLVNARKYAEVDKAQIELALTADGAVCLTVSDDGVGFDPEQIRAREGVDGGFGLFSLRERMEALGGKLRLMSAPGRGSSISLTVPLASPESSDSVQVEETL